MNGQNCIDGYLGMRQIASCGMGMEIIAYRDSNHVDIRFDDGTVVTDKKLYCQSRPTWNGWIEMRKERPLP